MLGGGEHQHSAQDVFVDDVVLYVICVMFHTEGEELHDQRQQLACLEVICRKAPRG